MCPRHLQSVKADAPRAANGGMELASIIDNFLSVGGISCNWYLVVTSSTLGCLQVASMSLARVGGYGIKDKQKSGHAHSQQWQLQRKVFNNSAGTATTN